MGRKGLQLFVLIGLVVATASGWSHCAADDSAENAARLEKLSPEEKEALLKKKRRFDDLSEPEKSQLRELHRGIMSDADAEALSETVVRYNRWLRSLDPPQRADLLDIRDPAERIAKIKELMQQQEERRFREFIRDEAAHLSSEDKETFFRWFGDFVMRHQESIVRHLPRELRDRLSSLPDEIARRRELMRGWSIQYSRHENDTPVPSQNDIDQLLAKLSAEARKPFASADTRAARVIEFMRAAAFSRLVPQVTRDELLKFYAGMKSDDPRRERLEGREGDELLNELRRMWVMDRWRERGGSMNSSRGGFPGPPPGRGGGPRLDDQSPPPRDGRPPPDGPPPRPNGPRPSPPPADRTN
jgi:hypothetical protein